MIIEPLKYVFLGSHKDVDGFFAKAQSEGFIEFIGSPRKKREVPKELSDILLAMKILKKKPIDEQIETDPPIQPQSIAKRIIHAYETIEHLNENKRLLRTEIARVGVFGDFSLSDLDFIQKEGGRVLQFFSLKSSKVKDVELPKDLVHVGSEYDLAYFVSISEEKKHYKGFIEIHIEKPVGILEAHLEMVVQEIKILEDDLKKYSVYFEYLNSGLAHLLNDHHLSAAKGNTSRAMGDTLFSIEAWIPSNKTEKLKPLLSEFTVHAENVKIDDRDRPPTYMENKSFSRIGEDLVKVYDIPSIQDRDPSSWVLWAFALFYAMIVADAGYGFLYLLAALFLKWKFPDWTGALKRLRTLILTISIFAMGWGVLTASFFGISLGPDNPLRKVSMIHALAKQKAEYHIEQQDETFHEWAKKFPHLKDVKDGHEFLVTASKVQEGKKVYPALTDFYDSILMEFSLLVGVIHIALSFIRYFFRNCSGFGWLAAMLGGYLFFPSVLGSTSLLNFTELVPKEIAFPLGKMLLYGGMSLAVVLAIVQNKLRGLEEVMNVIQIFADILSYLRLYALGLAGMIMADTFNNIGLSMGLWTGGIIIILIGHIVNITLGVMGGVIHGLRLNFLEWYHYCFEGGGKEFNPLRLLK